MTRHDQQILFTALAFVAVLLNENGQNKSKTAHKATSLAKLIESFCAVHVQAPFSDSTVSLVEESGAAEIDAAIDRHIQQLRQNEETHLPEDKETLLKFYDRLQQRKSRRMQRDFYEIATTDKLADLILHYFDEEMEDAERLS